jgi:hypothetical protein
MRSETISYILNSKNASSSYFQNDTVRFRVNINDQLKLDPKDICKISLRHCEIPIVFYQVSEERENNTLFIDSAIAPGITVLTIPDGTFNGNDLADLLQDLLILQYGANSFQVIYNLNTNKFIFKSTNGFVMFFQSKNGNLLGFTPDVNFNSIDLGPGAAPLQHQIIGIRGAHLQPVSTIHINTNLNISNLYSTHYGGYYNTIDVVPVSDLGTIQVVNKALDDFKCLLIDRTVSSIEVWLTDHDGKYLHLNNHNWSVVLLFEIERN